MNNQILQMLSTGVGQHRNNIRNDNTNQQLLQALRQAQTKGTNLRNDGQQQINQHRPTEQAQQAALRGQQGQLNQQAIQRGNAPKQLQIPNALYDFLPPEIQGNPASVTTRDLIQAAARKKERDSQPRQLTPEQELNKQKFEYSQEQDLYKRENPQNMTPVQQSTYDINIEKLNQMRRKGDQKPMSSDQSKASGFHDRMIASQAEIGKLPPDFDPSTTWEAAWGLTNVTASPEKQRYNQASNDWIRAKLRRESGAAIGDAEAKAEYEQYFPIWGDSDEVIEQKARARKVAENAMLKATGSAVGAGSTDTSSWKVMVDANGNRARVGPNGEIEEI